MEHLPLQKLLEKFYKIIDSNTEIKTKIQETINIYTHIKISLNAIIIKNNNIYFKLSSSIKNEIYIQKDEILKEIQNIYKEKAPQKIIFN